jgi:DTW domain-containing protein YfiP
VSAATPAQRRPVCLRCARPLRTCLCAWVRPTANAVAVRLWQHPDEVGHAKGSASLLSLSLSRCALHVSPPDQLDMPLPPVWLAPGAALLYPVDSADGSLAVPDASAVTSLIVLDGTWRQSRQMLRAQPALSRLQRVAVPDALLHTHGQRYRVRKAQRAGQLSTLEAVVLALGHIEQDADRYGPLLQAFDAWVAGLMASRPSV